MSLQTNNRAIASAKFDIEKITGKNNFNLWWEKMLTLFTKECELALEGKTKFPIELTSTQKNVIMKKAHCIIVIARR